MLIFSSSSTKGLPDMNTLEISSSTIPLLIPCIEIFFSTFSLVFTGSDVGRDVDMILCPDDFDKRFIDEAILFSFLAVLLGWHKELLKEKSPAAELLLKTPEEGFNVVGVAGEEDEVESRDVKLEVDELIEALKAFSFVSFFAFVFDVTLEI